MGLIFGLFFFSILLVFGFCSSAMFKFVFDHLEVKACSSIGKVSTKQLKKSLHVSPLIRQVNIVALDVKGS